MPTQDSDASVVDASSTQRIDTWNIERTSQDLRQFIEARATLLDQQDDLLFAHEA